MIFLVYLYRDAEETKDWIEEKNAACKLEDYGHDLATVQRLQRKHDGLERDLAALNEKVGFRRAPQEHDRFRGFAK